MSLTPAPPALPEPSSSLCPCPCPSLRPVLIGQVLAGAPSLPPLEPLPPPLLVSMTAAGSTAVILLTRYVLMNTGFLIFPLT